MSFGNPNNPYPPPPQQPPAYGYQQPPPAYGAPPAQPPAFPAPGYPASGYGNPPGGYGGHLGVAGNVPIASMGRRFGARFLDGLIFAAIYGGLSAAGVVRFGSKVKDCDSGSADAVSCIGNATDDMVKKVAVAFGAFIVIGLLYEWLMTAFMGRTLGKMMAGIRVIKMDTGRKPGVGAAFVRWFIPIAGILALGIGQLLVYLSPFWDGSGLRQGWHDKAAGTMVIQN